jgi:hypothetical protein
MRALTALAITAVLLAAAIGATVATNRREPLMVLAIGTAIWAAIDSARLGLHKHKGGSNSPVGVFLGVLILWFVFFPLYLITRARLKAGELPLKKQYQIPAVEVAE